MIYTMDVVLIEVDLIDGTSYCCCDTLPRDTSIEVRVPEEGANDIGPDFSPFEIDLDMFAAGIDGVFQQFLDDTGGPLDDLPGGNFRNHRRRKLINAWHFDWPHRNHFLPQRTPRTPRGGKRF